MNRKNLSIEDIARIGLFLDDPYGEGGRLECVREPSVGRMAAEALLEGQPMLDGERFIKEEYLRRVMDGENWRKDGTLVAWIKRNIG